MTNEEALKIIKVARVTNDTWGFYDDKAFMLAIEALKKQIPKKPIAFWDGNENLIECPACKCPIDICEAEWSRQFCGKCGQAVAHIIDTERELKRFDKSVNGDGHFFKLDDPCEEKLGQIRINECGEYICAKICNEYVWVKV